MSKLVDGKEVRIIPINRIAVLNPRERNAEAFAEIVESIKNVGLKKPITVTASTGDDGIESFKLVCGEGRLKAFIQLGQTQIPAIVVQASQEDAFIMGLAENLARRRYRPLELITGIRVLHSKGYSPSDIARKTGLSREYVASLVLLIEKGEERILAAVEAGHLPIKAAIEIIGAGADDKALQLTLHEAYVSGDLRGQQLLEVRKVLQQRAQFGKACGGVGSHKRSPITPSGLVRAYRQEVERQRLVFRRGAQAQERLMVVVSAMRKLLADENFVTLLRAEGLDTLPKYLAERIAPVHQGGRR